MSAKKLGLLIFFGVLVVSVVAMSKSLGPKNETLGLETQTTLIKDVNPPEAAALIQRNRENKDFVIIDVRTPEEYASGHIERAINLDYSSGTFRDELDKLDKNKTYLAYCQTSGRSKKATDMMRELGFGEVYNMLGGITGWSAEGLSTVK